MSKNNKKSLEELLKEWNELIKNPPKTFIFSSGKKKMQEYDEKLFALAKEILEYGKFAPAIVYLQTGLNREHKLEILNLCINLIKNQKIEEISNEANTEFSFLFLHYLETDPQIASLCLEILATNVNANISFLFLAAKGEVQDKEGRKRPLDKELQKKSVMLLLENGKNLNKEKQDKIWIITKNYLRREGGLENFIKSDPEFFLVFLEFAMAARESLVSDKDLVTAIFDYGYVDHWSNFTNEQKKRMIDISLEIYPLLIVNVALGIKETPSEIRVYALDLIIKNLDKFSSGREKLIENFPGLLRDPDTNIRIKALEFAENAEWPELLKEVLECLNEDRDVNVKIAALKAIAEMVEGRIGRGFVGEIYAGEIVNALSATWELSSQKNYASLETSCLNALKKIIGANPGIVEECLNDKNLSNPTLLIIARSLVIENNPKQFESLSGTISSMYTKTIQTKEEPADELLLAYYAYYVYYAQHLLTPAAATMKPGGDRIDADLKKIFDLYMKDDIAPEIQEICMGILIKWPDQKEIRDLIANWEKMYGSNDRLDKLEIMLSAQPTHQTSSARETRSSSTVS